VPSISDSHRDLLDSPHVVSLATVGSDGLPQVTAIWAMLDGDVVRTSLYPGRQKYKNLAARPQATVFVIDPANPYRTLEVRGRVEIEEDADLEFLTRMLAFYGTDLDHFPAPLEGRVVVTLHPTRIVENG
jgi:PPOX class probable F420-dependent enzyme